MTGASSQVAGVSTTQEYQSKEGGMYTSLACEFPAPKAGGAAAKGVCVVADGGAAAFAAATFALASSTRRAEGEVGANGFAHEPSHGDMTDLSPFSARSSVAKASSSSPSCSSSFGRDARLRVELRELILGGGLAAGLAAGLRRRLLRLVALGLERLERLRLLLVVLGLGDMRLSRGAEV